jgi:hypothetical protein
MRMGAQIQQRRPDCERISRLLLAQAMISSYSVTDDSRHELDATTTWGVTGNKEP